MRNRGEQSGADQTNYMNYEQMIIMMQQRWVLFCKSHLHTLPSLHPILPPSPNNWFILSLCGVDMQCVRADFVLSFDQISLRALRRALGII
jgi:hypothetical protein